MTEEKLTRGIGRWDLTAIAINIIIGTGIFLLPAQASAQIGSYSIFALIFCAIIVAFIVLCFVEVSSRFQSTGGMYLYARESFGSVVGFEVGWLYWIVRVTTFATNCNALLTYLEFFVPSASQGWLRIAIICSIVVFLTIVNLLGVRESAILTNISTVGKVVPLLILAIVGLFFINPANFHFDGLPEYGKFSGAMLPLIYAYVGFEAAAIPAGETRDPQRSVPFAVLTALGFCTVLFTLIQLVCIGVLPDLATSKLPLADAAGVIMGTFGASFITAGALVSIFGNLNGGFLTASRMPYAIAEHGELPAVLAKTHERFKTPYVSVLLTAVVTLVVTIQSSFISALTIAVITRLLVYAVTCLSVPVFRLNRDAPQAKARVPYAPLAALVSLGLIVWLLTTVDFMKDGVRVLVIAGIGVGIYAAFWLYRKWKS